MRLVRRLFFWAVLTLFAATPQANAQIDVGIEVGLDKGTRDLFDRLPQEVKAALLDLIRQTQPLIDQSVSSYIKQLNQVFADNITLAVTQVACVDINGPAKTWSDIFSNSILHLFIPDPSDKILPMAVPPSISQLGTHIAEARARIRFDTPVAKIRDAYVDLLHEAALVNCSARSVGDPASVMLTISGRVNVISDPSMEWTILTESGECKAINECIDERASALDSFLASADSRDAAAAGAQQLVASLPPKPAPPDFWQSVGLAQFDIAPYEHLLLEMRGVERAVEAAKVSRETNARQKYDANLKDEASLDTFMTDQGASANGPAPGAQDFRNMICRSEGAVARVKTMIDLGNAAVALDGRLEQMWSAKRDKLAGYLADLRAWTTRATNAVPDFYKRYTAWKNNKVGFKPC